MTKFAGMAMQELKDSSHYRFPPLVGSVQYGRSTQKLVKSSLTCNPDSTVEFHVHQWLPPRGRETVVDDTNTGTGIQWPMSGSGNLTRLWYRRTTVPQSSKCWVNLIVYDYRLWRSHDNRGVYKFGYWDRVDASLSRLSISTRIDLQQTYSFKAISKTNFVTV